MRELIHLGFSAIRVLSFATLYYTEHGTLLSGKADSISHQKRDFSVE